jgi:hypothetical protein
MKRILMNRPLAIAVALLPLLLAGSLGFAQQNAQRTASPPNKELPLRQIVKLPGKLLAETKTTGPTGDLKLTGYRVEEVTLSQSLSTEVRGQQVNVNKAWRVTVTGGPFPVRALPAVIWVDDQIVGYGIENETLSQITAVTFDDSVIHDGGVVSLSYGENKEGRTRISQKIQLKREGGNQ